MKTNLSLDIEPSKVMNELYNYCSLLENESADIESLFENFPFQTILDYYHKVGKHFVGEEILEKLLQIEEKVNQRLEGDKSFHSFLLQQFLVMLLDKHKGIYDYHTYIGSRIISELVIPDDLEFIEYLEVQILHLAAILSDIIRFECHTLIGADKRFQRNLSSNHHRKRIISHVLRAIKVYSPFSYTLQLPKNLDETLKILQTELDSNETLSKKLADMLLKVSEDVLSQLPEPSLKALNLIIFPVYTIHDEYMFIRCLQSLETIFSIVVKGFQTCHSQIKFQKFKESIAAMEMLKAIFDCGPALFRVVMMMEKDNFAAFRIYTEGASAIQSKQYKMIEILAAEPLKERLNSPAFDSVPSIKKDYLEGNISNFETYMRDYLTDESICKQPIFEEWIMCMKRFEETFISWNNMHFKMAVKMIGNEQGTGYTLGPSYLEKYASRKLFPFLHENELT
ncbi:hypothetical protein [Chengkuizengella sediminis]|uniref:hypothetical protein n=1 Tax=Chengkuizengella sediminis TaxID=1885917 RepID=UPI00138977F2|nr:hypothetical protein [Chengkuizengella sediminis]NDI37121.1 hypothetical protein [Chengkuizengella sediminis]